MTINRIIKFILHKRNKDDTKNLAIRMRCTIRGKKPLDIATGHHIDEKDWDKEKQCAKKCKGASVINRTINSWRAIMDEIFARFELIEKRQPTIDELRELFNDTVGRETTFTKVIGEEPSETDDLWLVFNKFIDSQAKVNSWSDATYEKFMALKNHLRAFDPHLSFVTITDNKLTKYLEYLNGLGFHNTTIEKNISFLRSFLRWASEKGYYKGQSHITFRPKFKGLDCREVIYLTLDELKKVETYVFPPNRTGMEHVRDVFVFCCYTGLRFSDAAKLKRSDIHGGKIHIVTTKTTDPLKIDLNKHSRAILDKYKDAHLPDDLALPVISNTKTNSYLKVLGMECGIDEPTRMVYFTGNQRHEHVFPKYQLMTTHVARRTFVVTALTLGIPAEVIMKYTGHATYEAMKPYVAIAEELKRKSMDLFDDI